MLTEGHKRYLVITEDGFTARARLPLHILSMSDEDMAFHIKPLCRELKAKMEHMKRLGTLVN